MCYLILHHVTIEDGGPRGVRPVTAAFPDSDPRQSGSSGWEKRGERAHERLAEESACSVTDGGASRPGASTRQRGRLRDRLDQTRAETISRVAPRGSL